MCFFIKGYPPFLPSSLKVFRVRLFGVVLFLLNFLFHLALLNSSSCLLLLATFWP